jgi:copper chaperone CopZ
MTTAFAVKDIHCQACAKRVTTAVQSVVPGAKVDVDIASGRVTVDPAPEGARIAAALTAAGYPAELVR